MGLHAHHANRFSESGLGGDATAHYPLSGGHFAGGTTVRRITFADLRPEGPPPTTSWEGEWQVHWDTDGGQIAPTRLKQRILTAAPTGTTAIAA